MANQFVDENDPRLDSVEKVERSPVRASAAGAPPNVVDPYQGGVVSSIGLQTDTANSQLPGVSLPEFRLMPVAQALQPVQSAAQQSVATQIAQTGGVSTVSLTVPAELSPTTQTGNKLKLVWSPEEAHTFFAGPLGATSLGGYLDVVTGFNANTTLALASASAATPTEFALLFHTNSFTTQPSAPVFTGFTLVDGGAENGVYSKLLTTAGPISTSSSLNLCQWVTNLCLFGSNGVAPTLVQKIGGPGGSVGSLTDTQNWTNTAGNMLIVVLFSSDFVAAAATTLVSDTLNGPYALIASRVEQVVGTGDPVAQYIYGVANCKAGANTVSFQTIGGSMFAGGVNYYEFNGLALLDTSAVPSFRPITGQPIGQIGDLPLPTLTNLGGVAAYTSPAHQFLTAINTDGSVTSAQPALADLSGVLPINKGGTGTATPAGVIAGSGVTVTGTFPAQTVSASGGGGGSAFQTTQRRTIYEANGTNNTLTSIVGDILQSTATSGTNTPLVPTTQRGPVLEFAPAGGPQILFLSSLVGSGINFTGGNSGNYVSGRNVKFQVRGYWSTTGDGDLWMGMFTGSNSGNDIVGIGHNSNPATNQVSGAGFRCFNKSGASLETTWHAYVSNGVTSTSTAVDTLVTQDTNEHVFAIIQDDTTPNVTFYIDGVLVATITATVIPAAAPMGMYISGWYATTPVNFGFGQVYIDSDF